VDLSALNSFLRPAYGESQKNVLTDMLQSAKRNRFGTGLWINIFFRKLWTTCPFLAVRWNLSKRADIIIFRICF
jgi:hypothetical protein